MDDAVFRKTILDHWRQQGRHGLPWRQTSDPYHILVSEIMLQQTQVDRVIPMYQAFLALFPAFRVLAPAPVAKILKAWQGLGYNRRALMLQRCAQAVVQDHNGVLPDDVESLKKLPGIGPYTAGAVMAFAFNKPVPLIETNIRRVYLHHYFGDQPGVDDAQLMPIIERTLDIRNPRRWYSALMDYGTALAKMIPNPNRRSAQYVRQSTFEGSDRQVRGAILKLLITGKSRSEPAIIVMLAIEKDRAKKIIAGLIREGFIRRHGRTLVCA